MRALLPILLVTIPLFSLVQATDYGYVDDNFLSSEANNSIDEYPVLAAQLNCSEFVVLHEGVKTEEIVSEPNRLTNIRRNPPQTPEITKDVSHPTETLYDEYAENDSTGAVNGDDSDENESTEKPAQSDDNEKKISKRAVVTIERLWTADNISIIDGYSKVAIYPMNDRRIIKRETATENMVAESKTSECTAPFNDNGEMFNWYEIIVENGGPPGEVKATRLTPNITEVLEPCYRPISDTYPLFEDLLYEYESIEFEKVYRSEKAFLRFAGTLSEFVNIVGELVWAPQPSVRRYYRVSYRKDDTGFYVNVRRRHKCVFEENPLAVTCEQVDDFTPCETVGEDVQVHGFALPAGLQASLVG